MTEEMAGRLPQPRYLIKVVIGLGLLMGLAAAAFWLPYSPLTQVQQSWLLALLVMLAAALFPLVQWVYHRMDELQRLMHKRASVITLPLTAAIACCVGVLQANQLMPLFNQFWGLALIVVLWGINLMLADRRYR